MPPTEVNSDVAEPKGMPGYRLRDYQRSVGCAGTISQIAMRLQTRSGGVT